MNPQKQMREFLEARKSPLFSISYLEKLHRLDTRFCLPGSVKIGPMLVPVIGIHIHPDGLDYFGIRNGPVKNMDHRFRYLDNPEGDEIVQICFHLKSNRQLALNLDPLSPLIRRFLGDVFKVELYGFIFFCLREKVLITSFTSPDAEETGWIERNLKRAKRLRKNDFETIMMDSMLHDDLTGNAERKYYVGEKGTEEECFFNSSAGSVPLERVNEYLF